MSEHLPEQFELVKWSDIAEGDHVWSMGGVCVITGPAFRNTDEYDRDLNPGLMRFPHRDESGSESSPPMELGHRVPRLMPPERRLPVLTLVHDNVNDGVAIEVNGKQAWWENSFDSIDQFFLHSPEFLGRPVILRTRTEDGVE